MIRCKPRAGKKEGKNLRRPAREFRQRCHVRAANGNFQPTGTSRTLPDKLSKASAKAGFFVILSDARAFGRSVPGTGSTRCGDYQRLQTSQLSEPETHDRAAAQNRMGRRIGKGNVICRDLFITSFAPF